ncbi:MAG: hypothetical protein ACRC2R_07965 [Xenococcaceae cyanobacterium]
MKYFFLAQGWQIARVWEFSGLWNEGIWRRKPNIQRLSIGMEQHKEKLWLYQVEDAVVTIEVKPTQELSDSITTIGQVLLKRLIAAEQAIEILAEAEIIFNYIH